VYEHDSAVLGCVMRFSVFIPPRNGGHEGQDHSEAHGLNTAVPFLMFLSGLTCTHDNFTTKAGAYAYAAAAGLAIIAPDTSPRGDDIPDDADAYDFGQGAGFYINATQEPWAASYQMERYITQELDDLVCQNFDVRADRRGISGHSMGGHGALTLALKYPDRYKSVSAFSPIVAPSQVPWGQKAFMGYLGTDQTVWQQNDACALMHNLAKGACPASKGRAGYAPILIDQGTGDDFLTNQLRPELFAAACADANQDLILRMQPDYDHSYYFIQSFIKDHIDHHAGILA